MISYADRFGTKSSLTFIDVNNMKKLNDTKWHGAADKTLLHLQLIKFPFFNKGQNCII